MKTISIEWLTDASDCDTCGFNYAEGAEVRLNGDRILNLVPVASCFGGANWSEDEVFAKIFDTLGYKLETSHGD